MAFEYPLLEPILIFAKWKIPVFGGFLYKTVTRIILVCGVNKFVGRECSATFLTLVAIGTLSSASWTCTHNVAVGKEFACHLVAVLQLGVLFQFTLVIERTEEIGGKLMVDV